jgi:hypothetical protein
MQNVGTSQCRKLGRQTLDQVLFRLHHLCTHLTLGIHRLDLAHQSDRLGLWVFLSCESQGVLTSHHSKIRGAAAASITRTFL